MPTAIVFTADAGADVLTAAAHGLLTGDRFRTRNVGGALPAPLAAVTTYFAIRLDANSLKVATSSALALAGTAVNITDAGTGTHTLEYGLPYCEPRVATAGTQIYSADDNAAWDSLKAIHALFTGQTETVWGGDVTLAGDLEVGGEEYHGDVVTTLPGCAGVADSGVSRSTTNGGITSTAGTTIFYAFPLKRGDRPKSITFARSGDGSVDFTAIDVKISNTNTDTNSSLGSTTLNNVGALDDTTIDLTDTPIEDEESLFVYFTVNAAAAVIRNVRLTHDRPRP